MLLQSCSPKTQPQYLGKELFYRPIDLRRVLQYVFQENLVDSTSWRRLIALKKSRASTRKGKTEFCNLRRPIASSAHQRKTLEAI
jgi:hypothetical protein